MTRHTQQCSTAAWSERDLERNPHDASDKSERVRSMFSAIARSYDLNNRVHSFGRDQAWRRRVVKLCCVQPTDDVLDVACGTGDLTEALAGTNPASITGLDFTQPMLDLAQRKATRHGLDAIRYVQGDATALPFDDASMDVLTIAFGLRNVSDPAAALAEFYRVLRPGGRLVVLEFSQPRNRMLRALNNVYCQRIMPLTATLLARDRSGAYRYLPRSVETFLHAEEIASALQSAGFSDVTGVPMTFGVCTATRGTVPTTADNSP